MLRVWAGPHPQTTGGDARKYEAAYKNGDAKTLAGFYSDDVDYIDQDGAEVLKLVQARINGVRVLYRRNSFHNHFCSPSGVIITA